jgi:hypothetical protein
MLLFMPPFFLRKIFGEADEEDPDVQRVGASAMAEAGRKLLRNLILRGQTRLS